MQIKSKQAEKLIVVTGGAGFIGSNFVKFLNQKGKTNILIVDHLNTMKKLNIKTLNYQIYMEKDIFLQLVKSNSLPGVSHIVHLGACSSTKETNKEYLRQNNYEYSKELYKFAVLNSCQFIYASSAATYGDGSQGYSDSERVLYPLNSYGEYKYLFDEWILQQNEKRIQCVGLKFFNVYGPNEYHKQDMASVVQHSYEQICSEGKVKLFKSYKNGFADGEQKRDFIYVKDVVDILYFFMMKKKISGIFNVGTGRPRSFLDLAKGVYKAMDRTPHIVFIEMPSKLRNKYQYYTKADVKKLRSVGYKLKFTTLENGINDYVKNYLQKQRDD